jgi:hypothetical protein
MAVGFLISTLFVVVDPISSVFPNAFWVGKFPPLKAEK